MSVAPGPFWSLLNDGDRSALYAAGTIRGYPPGTALLREGDPALVVVVLLTGQAKVTSLAPNGYEAIFALLGPGDILGELSTIDGMPCTATVSAIDHVRGLALAPERFLAALDRSPRLSQAVLRVVANRLRRSNRRQVEYGETTAAGRLAALLVDLAARHGSVLSNGAVRIRLPVNQRELGSLISASREAVARALRDLRDQNIVRTGPREVTVLRPDLLERLVSAS